MKKTNRQVLIQSFIQNVCTPTTTGKRVKAIRRLFGIDINWTRDECGYIWKGLFYAVWYTEMGKGCEDLIFEIVNHCETKKSMDLIVAGFEAMEREWLGIDYIRIDKFLFLVRHLTNKAIKLHLAQNFPGGRQNEEMHEPLRENCLAKITSAVHKCCGLICHFAEIFFEEAVKVMDSMPSLTKKPCPLIVSLLIPFIDVLAINEDFRTQNTVTEFIFTHIERDLVHNFSMEDQILVLKMTAEKLMEIGGRKQVKRKNRNIIYGVVKKLKATLMRLEESKEEPVSQKRKRKTFEELVREGLKRRSESSAPFVKSIIPLPMP